MLYCTNLAVGEVLDGLESVVVPKLCFLNQFPELVLVGVAQSLVKSDDLGSVERSSLPRF